MGGGMAVVSAVEYRMQIAWRRRFALILHQVREVKWCLGPDVGERLQCQRVQIRRPRAAQRRWRLVAADGGESAHACEGSRMPFDRCRSACLKRGEAVNSKSGGCRWGEKKQRSSSAR